MPSERLLEDVLAADISILDSGLLVLGRQFITPNGKRLDLLAVAGDGSLTVIELKRGQTEREVVVQALDYGSYVQTLTRDDLLEMYESQHPGRNLDIDFTDYFGTDLPEEVGEHKLLIVAASMDAETERIVNYLAGFNVPINAVFFRYFDDGDDGLLARTWLRDPEDIDATTSKSSARKRNYGPWNGTDYYVSFASDEHRDWEDARRLGFVSAGWGRWYTKTLHNLEPGHRVFVRAPGQGYIGVGVVTQPARLVEDVQVPGPDGVLTPLLDADLNAPAMHHHPGDHDKGETVVRVNWYSTVPISQAYSESGLFGNQNSACKLSDATTIEKVCKHFNVPVDRMTDGTFVSSSMSLRV
ncbi:hypothetical protein C8N24_0687 [Solirubrobacter pauli]|uniref:DUF91 domain-containing protein n=2 Tax=Solirubrobacter pauli TaxID=166793 RepID=A0A660L783_9ACTN|nr:hypothetical protein C8N24_0687 [Solirubrobacter pauli]